MFILFYDLLTVEKKEGIKFLIAILFKRVMVQTRIIKETSYFQFRELIDKYKEKIKINPHAYFRLSEMQRKVFKDDTLKAILTEEKPAFIGLQQNKNYAAFFSKKKGYMRIMFAVKKEHIEIVTFYITDHIPKI